MRPEIIVPEYMQAGDSSDEMNVCPSQSLILGAMLLREKCKGGISSATKGQANILLGQVLLGQLS